MDVLENFQSFLGFDADEFRQFDMHYNQHIVDIYVVNLLDECGYFLSNTNVKYSQNIQNYFCNIKGKIFLVNCVYSIEFNIHSKSVKKGRVSIADDTLKHIEVLEYDEKVGWKINKIILVHEKLIYWQQFGFLRGMKFFTDIFSRENAQDYIDGGGAYNIIGLFYHLERKVLGRKILDPLETLIVLLLGTYDRWKTPLWKIITDTNYTIGPEAVWKNLILPLVKQYPYTALRYRQVLEEDLNVSKFTDEHLLTRFFSKPVTDLPSGFVTKFPDPRRCVAAFEEDVLGDKKVTNDLERVIAEIFGSYQGQSYRICDLLVRYPKDTIGVRGVWKQMVKPLLSQHPESAARLAPYLQWFTQNDVRSAVSCHQEVAVKKPALLSGKSLTIPASSLSSYFPDFQSTLDVIGANRGAYSNKRIFYNDLQNRGGFSADERDKPRFFKGTIQAFLDYVLGYTASKKSLQEDKELRQTLKSYQALEEEYDITPLNKKLTTYLSGINLDTLREVSTQDLMSGYFMQMFSIRSKDGLFNCKVENISHKNYWVIEDDTVFVVNVLTKYEIKVRSSSRDGLTTVAASLEQDNGKVCLYEVLKYTEKEGWVLIEINIFSRELINILVGGYLFGARFCKQIDNLAAQYGVPEDNFLRMHLGQIGENMGVHIPPNEPSDPARTIHKVLTTSKTPIMALLQDRSVVPEILSSKIFNYIGRYNRSFYEYYPYGTQCTYIKLIFIEKKKQDLLRYLFTVCRIKDLPEEHPLKNIVAAIGESSDAISDAMQNLARRDGKNDTLEIWLLILFVKVSISGKSFSIVDALAQNDSKKSDDKVDQIVSKIETATEKLVMQHRSTANAYLPYVNLLQFRAIYNIRFIRYVYYEHIPNEFRTTTEDLLAVINKLASDLPEIYKTTQPQDRFQVLKLLLTQKGDGSQSLQSVYSSYLKRKNSYLFPVVDAVRRFGGRVGILLTNTWKELPQYANEAKELVSYFNPVFAMNLVTVSDKKYYLDSDFFDKEELDALVSSDSYSSEI